MIMPAISTSSPTIIKMIQLRTADGSGVIYDVAMPSNVKPNDAATAPIAIIKRVKVNIVAFLGRCHAAMVHAARSAA
jgi:hypothetical protein